MRVTLQPISFRGRLAAAATRDRYFLAPHIEVLEADHPDRVFVSLMCCYAHDVMTGVWRGPYSDGDAERAARGALIDAADFTACWYCDDAVLAERYGVPLDQIRARRVDLGPMGSIAHGGGGD